MGMGEQPSSRAVEWVLAALGAGAFLAMALLRPDLTASEARVTEGACRAFLAGTTEGRQALVNSVWYPPLTFLLRLPLVAVLPKTGVPYASLIVSATSGAAVLFLLQRMLKECGFGWFRWLAIGGLAASGTFLKSCADGSSTLAVAFLAALTARGLTQWAARRQVRFLVYLGMGAALLAGASFDLLPWLGLVAWLLLVDTLFAPFRSAQREGVVILGLLPSAYVAGLWMLANWLVMGDGLYAFRSLLAGAQEGGALASPAVELTRADYAAAGVAATALGLALPRADRAGAFAGAMGASVAVAALWLAGRGLLWSAAPLLVCLPLVATVSLAHLGTARGMGTFGRFVLALTPAALTGYALYLGVGGLPSEPTGAAAYAGARGGDSVRAIEAYVRDHARYPKVFVCGHEGFDLLWNRRGDVFVHALDFDFAQSKKDYAGHDLFLLVRRPRGRAAMDSVHRKYPEVFALGADTALYAGTWGDWRLFELVVAPRRLPKG
jgi:hypothetical protein